MSSDHQVTSSMNDHDQQEPQEKHQRQHHQPLSRPPSTVYSAANNGSATTKSTSATNDAAQKTTVEGSVVSDLLRVYESLTQSSTPQVFGDEHMTGGAGKHASEYSREPLPSTSSNQFGGYAIPLPANFSGVHHPSADHLYSDHHQQQQPHSQLYTIPPTTQEFAHPGFQATTCYEAHQYSQSKDTFDRHGKVDGDDTCEGMEGRLSSRQKRRGSDTSNGTSVQRSRKKSKSSDGRWSKRFTWPEDLHRDFVSAIFDVGLKHSSPSTIQEHMPQHESINNERIKSHLQKYRMHRVKSKKQFISSYEASLKSLQENGLDGIKSMSGSEPAAHLTFVDTNAVETEQAHALKVDGAQEHRPQHNDTLILPQLTESEKVSPMGAAMGHLMGLFLSLRHELMAKRATEAKANEVQSINVSETTGENTHKVTSQAARTSIEESSQMKREMQSQMALQNKMRALKQQELNKYKHNDQPAHAALPPDHRIAPEANGQVQMEPTESKFEPDSSVIVQGAGEAPRADEDEGRHRGISLGGHEDFWHNDMVDDQLFEFLMNS